MSDETKDWFARNFTAGNILTILTVVGSLYVFHGQRERELATIGNDIVWIKSELRSLRSARPNFDQ